MADSLARKAAQQIERERFEKWCPITITDPEKAPRADALKRAYWTSWQACAESLAPMREALQALVETYGDYSRAAEFVEAMAKAERLVKGQE